MAQRPEDLNHLGGKVSAVESKQEVIDFGFRDEGSIWIVKPLTPEAKEFAVENIYTDETQFWAGGFVVEPRRVIDLFNGLQADGFAVEEIS